MNAVRNVDAASGATTRKPAVRDRYLNRELSNIDFNARVLALADDPTTPLLERAKFLAIFATNMDEFFQVRVAGLKQQAAAGIRTRSSDGLTPREQLSAIAAKVVPLAERHARMFAEDVMPALSEAGVKVLRWAELEEPQRDELNQLFREKIFQVLTPLAVDSGRPFPYISNLSLNLAVLVRNTGAGRMHFARIKVPPILPRFVSFAEDRYFTPLEEVIAANLDQLFPGMEIVEHHTFRVTRNADLEIDDGADDLLEALEEQLSQRRARPAVRLEVEQTIPQHVLELLMSELEVGDEDIYMLPAPLDLSGLWGLHAIDRPELKDEPYLPVTHPDLSLADEDVSIFEVLGDRDVLVHHPYESFTSSVQRFIEEAAADPGRARDQADALPHRRQPDRERADRGGRARQAGGGADRDQGPLRRERQHRLGAHAGEGGVPRRVRARGSEDPLQALPGRARRRWPPEAVRARRHGQLQPDHGAHLRGHGPVHRGSGAGRRGRPPVQLHHRLLTGQEVQVA